VQVLAEGGRSLRCDVALDEMPHARLYGSRHAFKNYSAFVNAGGMPASTIFHARPFAPHLQEATFSGCGRVSPLKNDPLLETIGTGSRILLNGAEGFVIGAGTRSSLDRPNLSAFADMHCMRAEYMGGFATAAGPECICSLAVAIPLVSERILQEVARPDGEIDLPVNDVACRQQVGLSDYGDVWDGSDLEVEFDPASCLGCQRCEVEQACPMGAVTGGMDKDGTARATRDEGLCFHCGLCVSVCPSSAFSARLGEIMMKSNMQSTIEGGAAEGCAIPVVLRQSDRLRALRLAEELKRRILDGSFRMAPPVERIY